MNDADAIAHVAAMFPNAQSVVMARIIHPGRGAPRNLHCHAGDFERDLLPQLQVANAHGWNVYVAPNAMRAVGVTGNAGIVSAGAIFCDWDVKQLGSDDPSAWSSIVARRCRDAWLPEPSIELLSGGGVHAYWLLDAPLLDLALWDRLQSALIHAVGSDPVCKNRERIMRLAGSVNWKYEPPRVAKLTKCEPSLRYSVDDLGSVLLHANNLDDAPKPVVKPAAIRSRSSRPGESIIDRVNDALDPAAILTSFGYTVRGNKFLRPGKTGRDHSGFIRRDRGRLVTVHFSSNDALNDGRFGGGGVGIHDSFSLLTKLKYHGDAKRATRELARMLEGKNYV